MIFDQLAAILEIHVPKLVHMAQQARLFWFPKIAHEVLPKKIDAEILHFLADTFFL